MVRLWLGLTNSYNLFHTRDLPPAILNTIYDATSRDLAGQAGVARIVVQRLEGGRGCILENLIRILRALGLLEQLDAFLPEPGLSPLQLAKTRGRERLRAAGRRGQAAEKE